MEHAPLTTAEIACADRWDRCVAAAVHIDVHGDSDPLSVLWAREVLASEAANLRRRAEQPKEPACNA